MGVRAGACCRQVGHCRRRKNNRAQTLYRRLGFCEIADHRVHWDMEWGAAADHRTNVI